MRGLLSIVLLWTLFFLASCSKEEVVDEAFSFQTQFTIQGDTSFCLPVPDGGTMQLTIDPVLFGAGDYISLLGDIQPQTNLSFNGNLTFEISMYDPGSVLLIIKHPNSIDTITVQFEQCWYLIVFPDVFTPSYYGTSLNWYPFSNHITDLAWEIRSEHNELILTCPSGQNCEWDGTWNGQSAPSGLYQYFATYSTPQGDVKEAHGWIELYR